MTVNYKLLVSALIAICIASLTALISDVFRQFLIPSDSPFAIEHHLLRSPTLQKLGALVSNVICVVGFVGGGIAGLFAFSKGNRPGFLFSIFAACWVAAILFALVAPIFPAREGLIAGEVAVCIASLTLLSIFSLIGQTVEWDLLAKSGNYSFLAMGFLTVAYPIGIFANLLLPNIFTNDTLFYLGWLAKFVNYLMLLIIAALGTYTAGAFFRGTTFKYHFISAEGE